MNQKEINEIKRCFRPDRTAISHIFGCYVNTNHEIIDRFDAALGVLPQEEAELYLDRLKKALGGAPGRNLIDIVFTPEQVADSDEHRLLSAMRDSMLNDPEIREEFYQKVVDSLEPEDQNYLILAAADRYDVPRRGKDGADRRDESENVYTFVICAICPVKDGGAGLRYDHEDKMFHISGSGQVAGPPMLGFLFPAFDNRCANINNALYYARQPQDLHNELIDGLFRTEAPMSATEQREAFQAALADSLEEDFNYDVMQSVHEQLRERIVQHKEEKDPEALALSVREVGDILAHSGVTEEHTAAFQERCRESFGEHAALQPANLIDSGRFELVTQDAKITVNPEVSYMIETRVIDGRKYILIPADAGVEINGLPVHVRGADAPAGDGKNADADSAESTSAEDSENADADSAETTSAENGEDAPAEDGEAAPAEDGEAAPAEGGEADA